MLEECVETFTTSNFLLGYTESEVSEIIIALPQIPTTLLNVLRLYRVEDLPLSWVQCYSPKQILKHRSDLYSMFGTVDRIESFIPIGFMDTLSITICTEQGLKFGSIFGVQPELFFVPKLIAPSYLEFLLQMGRLSVWDRDPRLRRSLESQRLFLSTICGPISPEMEMWEFLSQVLAD
jgi:hypothetical protein